MMSGGGSIQTARRSARFVMRDDQFGAVGHLNRQFASKTQVAFGFVLAVKPTSGSLQTIRRGLSEHGRHPGHAVLDGHQLLALPKQLAARGDGLDVIRIGDRPRLERARFGPGGASRAAGIALCPKEPPSPAAPPGPPLPDPCVVVPASPAPPEPGVPPVLGWSSVSVFPSLSQLAHSGPTPMATRRTAIVVFISHHSLVRLARLIRSRRRAKNTLTLY